MACISTTGNRVSTRKLSISEISIYSLRFSLERTLNTTNQFDPDDTFQFLNYIFPLKQENHKKVKTKKTGIRSIFSYIGAAFFLSVWPFEHKKKKGRAEFHKRLFIGDEPRSSRRNGIPSDEDDEDSDDGAEGAKDRKRRNN